MSKKNRMQFIAPDGVERGRYTNLIGKIGFTFAALGAVVVLGYLTTLLYKNYMVQNNPIIEEQKRVSSTDSGSQSISKASVSAADDDCPYAYKPDCRYFEKESARREISGTVTAVDDNKISYKSDTDNIDEGGQTKSEASERTIFLTDDVVFLLAGLGTDGPIEKVILPKDVIVGQKIVVYPSEGESDGMKVVVFDR